MMEAKPGELVNLGVGMRAIPLTRYDWREEGVNLINKLPPPSHWAELLLMISLQPKICRTCPDGTEATKCPRENV